MVKARNRPPCSGRTSTPKVAVPPQGVPAHAQWWHHWGPRCVLQGCRTVARSLFLCLFLRPRTVTRPVSEDSLLRTVAGREQAPVSRRGPQPGWLGTRGCPRPRGRDEDALGSAHAEAASSGLAVRTLGDRRASRPHEQMVRFRLALDAVGPCADGTCSHLEGQPWPWRGPCRWPAGRPATALQGGCSPES